MKSMTPKELKELMDQGNGPTLVDVREEKELAICSLGGIHIPSGQVAQRFTEIPRDTPVVVYCRSGGRSGAAIGYLESQQGFTNLTNLSGGILGWADTVDPSVPKY